MVRFLASHVLLLYNQEARFRVTSGLGLSWKGQEQEPDSGGSEGT